MPQPCCTRSISQASVCTHTVTHLHTHARSRAATLFTRPPEVPGNNTLQWDYVWPNNCTVDSPWAHPQLRCYAYVGLYVDLAARGLDADSSGKSTFSNGYMVRCFVCAGV